MTDRLKGKIAIISGGATGMGGAADQNTMLPIVAAVAVLGGGALLFINRKKLFSS